MDRKRNQFEQNEFIPDNPGRRNFNPEIVESLRRHLNERSIREMELSAFDNLPTPSYSLHNSRSEPPAAIQRATSFVMTQGPSNVIDGAELRRPLPSVESLGLRSYYQYSQSNYIAQESNHVEQATFDQWPPYQEPILDHQLPAYEQQSFIPQQSAYDAPSGQAVDNLSYPNNDLVPRWEQLPAIEPPVQPAAPAILMVPIGELVVENAAFGPNFMSVITYPVYQPNTDLQPVYIVPQPLQQQPLMQPEMQPPAQNNVNVARYRVENIPESIPDAFTERDPFGIKSRPPPHQRYGWETGVKVGNSQGLATEKKEPEASSPSVTDNSTKKPTDLKDTSSSDPLPNNNYKKKEDSMVCTFCKSQKCPPSLYTNHTLRKRGIKGNFVTTCPTLRSQKCWKCGATGDMAHLPSKCPGFSKRF